MNPSIEQALSKYRCQNVNDYISAIREIMQELALQGLWRAGFFDHAAFYGGTALRILYGLDRSSEDMDFSLLSTDMNFRMSSFSAALKQELESYGFPVEFSEKKKSRESTIDSAFLKGNTLTELISIGLTPDKLQQVCSNNVIKIKLEIDLDPPPGFQTENKTLLFPVPHTVKTYVLPDLLAGKLHAILYRKWGNRVKGRDWYDMVWYASRHPAVNLLHLEQRIRQSGDCQFKGHLTLERLKELLHNAVDMIDVEKLKQDVYPFVTDPNCMDVWNREFFHNVVELFKSE